MRLFILLFLVSSLSYGQKINLVIPFAPGGNIDNIARLLIESTNKHGGQVTPIYKIGGDGVVGTNFVANKNEDNTLLFGSNGPLVYAPLLKNSEVMYDPIKNLIPIILTTKVYSVITSHPSTQIKHIDQLLNVNRRSDKFMFASASPVTIFHLHKIFGKDTLIVSFKVAPIAMLSVATGDIPFGMSTIPTSMPLIASGKIIPIAITSPNRLSTFKNVPTIGEHLKGLEISTWHGIFANHQHEDPQKYYTIFKKGLQDNNFIIKMQNLNINIPDNNEPKQLKQLLLNEIQTYEH